METNIRKHRRAPWLAAAIAVIACAAPAAAQSSDAGQLQIMPPKPMSTSKFGAWPEFPPPDPPPSADSKLPERPNFDALNAPLVAPTTPAPGTIENLPPFNTGRGKPKPGAFPQPDAPPGSLANPPASRVWTVQSDPKNAALPGKPRERTAREFGNGWKVYVNPKESSRDASPTASPTGAAATLAAPRSAAVGLRPEWNWHGYETYNQGRPITSQVSTSNDKANAADLAPFMKYAHTWRPSTIAGAPAVVEKSNPITGPSPPPLTHSVISEPVYIKPLPPASPVATPASFTRPGPLQPADFRAAAPPTPREPPASASASKVPLRVREKVSAICTGKCRNLIVELINPSRLRVAFLVKDQLDAEFLTNQLGGLPELAPYRVDFEVQIGQ